MDREQQRAAARAAAAFTAQPVKVPLQAWGGDIFVRRVTVEAAIGARESIDTNDARSLAKALARRICDETGETTFDEGSDEDVDLLIHQGVDFLLELNAAVAEIDSPGKASAPSANS